MQPRTVKAMCNKLTRRAMALGRILARSARPTDGMAARFMRLSSQAFGGPCVSSASTAMKARPAPRCPRLRLLQAESCYTGYRQGQHLPGASSTEEERVCSWMDTTF